MHIPFSAKFSRVFNFANFANFQPFEKIFQQKFLTHGVRCAHAASSRNEIFKNCYPRKFRPSKSCVVHHSCVSWPPNCSCNYHIELKLAVDVRVSYRVLSWGWKQDGSRMIVACISMHISIRGYKGRLGAYSPPRPGNMKRTIQWSKRNNTTNPQQCYNYLLLSFGTVCI